MIVLEWKDICRSSDWWADSATSSTWRTANSKILVVFPAISSTSVGKLSDWIAKVYQRSSIINLSICSESNVDQYRLEVSPFAHYKRSSTNRKYQQLGQEKCKHQLKLEFHFRICINPKVSDLSLGKSLSFALLELLRCKTDAIPHCVAATLESFRNVDQVEMIGLRLIT